MAMKAVMTIAAGLLLWTGPLACVRAQEEKLPNATIRLTGTVEKVDKDRAVILVAFDQVRREIVYDDGTRFTMKNQPATPEAVKQGRQVICRGKYDWRKRLLATRVEVQAKEK